MTTSLVPVSPVPVLATAVLLIDGYILWENGAKARKRPVDGPQITAFAGG
jgi:hypothetical protein